MTVVERHLSRELLLGIAMSVGGLLALAFFITLAAEADDIGQQGYTVAGAIWVVILKMPKIFHELLPAGTLIGALYAFGGLAATNELTILRATGFSVLEMLRHVWKVALLVVIIAILNMEWLAPAAERAEKIFKAMAFHTAAVEYAGETFWIRDGDYFIRLRGVQKGGTISSFQWMQLPEHGVVAEVGDAGKTHHDGSAWVMDQVQVNKIGKQQVTLEKAGQKKITSTVSEDLIRLAAMSPDDFSTPELLEYAGYLEENGLDANTYRHVFWSRVAMPFGLVVVLVLALPFAVGESRMQAASKRVVVGIFIGVGFYLFNKTFMNLGEIYHLSPLFTAFVLPSLLLAFALFMIRWRKL